MSQVADQIPALIDDLGFTIVTEHKALGAISNVPTMLTVLGSDPLVLLFSFRIAPDGTESGPLFELFHEVPEDHVSISVEEGFAWLKIHERSGATNESIRLLVNRVADIICATDLAPPAGCLRCGCAEGAELSSVEGRPSRLCPACRTEAIVEHQQLESELNRPKASALVSLPGVCFFVAGGWAVLWTFFDVLLEWGQIGRIEINKFTLLLIFGLVIGVGYLLGTPLGRELQRSGAIQRAPRLLSLLVIITAAVAGEIVYIALYLLRVIGIFDLSAAARLLGAFVAHYSTFWIFAKLRSCFKT